MNAMTRREFMRACVAQTAAAVTTSLVIWVWKGAAVGPTTAPTMVIEGVNPFRDVTGPVSYADFQAAYEDCQKGCDEPNLVILKG